MWSSCDATCGSGNRLRLRRCFNALPGDPGCEGDDIQSQICNTNVSASLISDKLSYSAKNLLPTISYNYCWWLPHSIGY